MIFFSIGKVQVEEGSGVPNLRYAYPQGSRRGKGHFRASHDTKVCFGMKKYLRAIGISLSKETCEITHRFRNKWIFGKWLPITKTVIRRYWSKIH